MRKRAQALLDRAKAGDLPDWDGIHTFSTK
jgi:hypothetical protein